MGSGASINQKLEEEMPWAYDQHYITNVRRELTGADPTVERKLEFQRQARLVGKSVQHLKLIRTMQAAMTQQRKLDAKKAEEGGDGQVSGASAARKSGGDATDEESARKIAQQMKGSGTGGGPPKEGTDASVLAEHQQEQEKKKSPEQVAEEELLDPLQRMLMEEMKATGVELSGELAEELAKVKEEKAKRAAEGLAKEKKKKVKTRQSLVSLQARLATCNLDPFDEDDEDELALALEDLDGNDMAKTKDMLENVGFASPTPSRENLRLMEFPFVHGCVLGIIDKAGYQRDLLLDKERDELKFDGRRDEEKFLLKFGTAAAHDLGTIDPEFTFG
jgi:hypothetical protein